MPTPTAAQAETAATPALPDSTAAAATAFVARQEADPKGGAAAADGQAAAGAQSGSHGKPKPRIDPNLVKREREANESLQRASAIEAKFKPLVEALTKKDLKGALQLMASEHGVQFKDFIEVLTSSGGDETPAQVAERIARETVDSVKAKDAEKLATEAAERQATERKEWETRVGAFREKLQTAAEGDPARWKQSATTGTGSKGWDAITAFHEGTNGGRLDEGEALDVVEESWDLVHAHFASTKQRLDIDKAIQLVVGELAKLGADAGRAKLKEARNPSVQGNARNEAGGQSNGGRAAEPRINNRTTSGAQGVVPARDPNAPVRFDKAAVDDAMRRALPHLANA